MKIPKTLKIGGHTYQVVVTSNLAERDGNAGATNAMLNLIRLDDTYPVSRQEETLLHEVLHAVFHQMGMNEFPELQQRQEYIVNTMANGLYQVLKDNKLAF